jgi:L-threonylcarbamoyladenylate synthase
VRHQLGTRVDVIIDAGPCPLATPSTIIDCTTDDLRILRAGAVPESEIRAVLAKAS